MFDSIFLFILCCYGITSIAIHGKIFDKIRPKNSFFHCSMCVGFHVGWLTYLMFIYTNLFSSFSYVSLFIFACISSGTSYILDNIVDDEGIRLK